MTNKQIQNNNVYVPQTELEFVNLVHNLFYDCFNSSVMFTEDVMRDIMFDLSEIKDASLATQMVVNANNFTFKDMVYIYFLGITEKEWTKNKNVFKRDNSKEIYVDSKICEFDICTRAKYNNISISVFLDWKYDVDSKNKLTVDITDTVVNDIRYDKNVPVPIEEFKHLPCYKTLDLYSSYIVSELNSIEDVRYELYRNAKNKVSYVKTADNGRNFYV